MTRQTKIYIAVSDLLAVRFECNHCGGSISVPMGKEVRVEKLQACPNCNEPWTAFGEGRSRRVIDEEIRGFVTSVQALDGLFRSLGELGFALSIEVPASVIDSQS